MLAKKTKEKPIKKAKPIFNRKAAVPDIDEAEIKRLKKLLAEEENLEADLRRDMEQIIKNRDRILAKQIKYIEARNRRLMLWIGVIFIMLILVTFWLASLRASIAPFTRATSLEQKYNTKEIKGNLTETMNKAITTINDLKEVANQIKTATTTVTGTMPEPRLPR
jgi:type II secretory pathway component PulM